MPAMPCRYMLISRAIYGVALNFPVSVLLLVAVCHWFSGSDNALVSTGEGLSCVVVRPFLSIINVNA